MGFGVQLISGRSFRFLNGVCSIFQGWVNGRMTAGIGGKRSHHSAAGGSSLIHVVGGSGQTIRSVSLCDSGISGGLGQSDRVGGFFVLCFDEDKVGARGLGNDFRDLIPTLGMGAAVPHFILTGGIAPEEANVVVGPIVKGAEGPPHQDNVAFLG